MTVFDGQTWQRYTSANGLLDDYTVALAQDLAGNIWVGYSGSGLSRLALSGDEGFDGQTWQHYTLALDMVGNSVHNLAVDHAGRLWFSAGYSLGMFDGQTWTIYQASPPLTGIPSPPLEPPANAPLIKPHIIEIGPDHPAYFGLSDMTVDAAGRVWFGTNAGATVFDGQTWLTYTQADGLPPGAIMDIAFDPAGHVWLVTSTGALAEFTPPAAPAPLPTPLSEVVPRLLDFTIVPTTALTTGDVISVTWQAVGEQAELCLLSGRPVYCQPAPVSGSQVITVDDALLTQAISGVWLKVAANNDSTGVSGEFKFQCRYTWFYDDPSGSCPEAPPIYSRGAAQYFEHGLMIWTEQPDQFYVFFDQDHQFTRFDAEWVKSSDFLAPPEPLPTPTGVAPASAPTAVAPPPGASEPVSGFGRVWQHYWRYEHNLPVTARQDIGWATGPEFEFETAYQCALGTAAYGRWGCSVRSPSGTVLGFAPQSTVRDRWVWREKTSGLSSCKSHFATDESPATGSVDAVFNQGKLFYLMSGQPWLSLT